MKEIQTVEAFDAAIASRAIIVFGTDWCQPCKLLGGLLDAIQSATPIFKVDAERLPVITRKYFIRNFPTTMVFEDSIPVETIIGMQGIAPLRPYLE